MENRCIQSAFSFEGKGDRYGSGAMIKKLDQIFLMLLVEPRNGISRNYIDREVVPHGCHPSCYASFCAFQ